MKKSKDMKLKSSTRDSFHRDILRDTFSDVANITDHDALLIMSILHVSEIHLTGPVLRGHKDLTWLAAITQRDAADAVAHLWAGTGDPRMHYMYWYSKWSTDWQGYRHLETLSAEEKERMRDIKLLLEAHPSVAQIVLEDPDMIAE